MEEDPSLSVGQKEIVQLTFYCRDLKPYPFYEKIDPQIKMFIFNEEEETYKLYDTTDILLNDKNPDFQKKIKIDFYFNRVQPLMFEIHDLYIPYQLTQFHDPKVVRTTLGDIITSRNRTLIVDCYDKYQKKAGLLIIQAESSKKFSNSVFFRFRAEQLNSVVEGKKYKLNSYFTIGRYRTERDFEEVYRSEMIPDTEHPRWAPFTVTNEEICGNNRLQKIRFEVRTYQHGDKGEALKPMIGYTHLTLDEVLEKRRRDWELIRENEGGVHGEIHSVIHPIPQFVDYLGGGLDLSLTIAIDFSLSNGDVRKPNSLHTVVSYGMNAYQRAIKSVADILLNYDSSKQVAVYGFGAVPKFPTYKREMVDHVFPCNGDAKDPTVYKISGIFEAYESALRNVEFSHPSLLAPVLKKVIESSQKSKGSGSTIYSIFLVLTDGEIEDLPQVMDLIVECSMLPISIIMVGVGERDFSDLVPLNKSLSIKNSKGQFAVRRCVQFVALKEFKSDQDDISRKVLEEIPTQLLSFMCSEGLMPDAFQGEKNAEVLNFIYRKGL